MSFVLVCCVQNLVGRLDEFFLFGCILEANMIDRKLSEKPIKFELSIGQLCQRSHYGDNKIVNLSTVFARWHQYARSSNTRFRGLPPLTVPNGGSIGSAVLP